MIKVSVIIPVFNVELYLEECLDSIISQSLQEIEIICVNDGSTDSSLNILYSYAQTDSRIQVINQSNRGQSSARNVGISIAKGAYIYFMDSDDILDTNALFELYKLAKQDQLDVLYFDASVIYENDELANKYGGQFDYIRKHEYKEVINGIRMFVAMYKNGDYRCQPCMQLIRTEHIRKYDLQFYNGIWHEDELFYFLCMMQAIRVSHLSRPYFIRRIRLGSTMTQEKSFRHFYGYLICFIHVLLFTVKNAYDNEVQKCIISYLEDFRNNLISLLIKADNTDSWMSMLTLTEQYIVKLMIIQTIYRKSIQLQEINSLSSLSYNNCSLKTDTIEWQFYNIQKSYSYRIGRCITWFPRKFRGVLRCIHEHGLLYTIKLIIKKTFSSSFNNSYR